jgi:D-alanine-D-alanine ligase
MDKILMKAVFRAHGLPVPDYVAIDRSAFEREPSQVIERIRAEVGLPCFVKPANLGSSVGISKARDEEQLMRALVEAAGYSARLIVERALLVREIECGVLGNDEPAASEVGEVMPAREFYDYEAKYRDPATRFEIPARVDAATRGRVQELALAAFHAVGASGMARVDFFLDRGSGAIYLNEINTIPGFTAMSVYPRLWAASGVGYPDLIDRLIALALQRHADQARNRTRYD